MKIYTKKGDEGYTDIGPLGGYRKDSDYLKALGDLDELNSWLGLIEEKHGIHFDPYDIKIIQHKLFNIGADISLSMTCSCSATLAEKAKETVIYEKDVEYLEEWIDFIENKLPTLKNFILPSYPADIHISRSVCRRAERSLVGPIDRRLGYRMKEDNNRIIAYVNRLSDLLFVLARYICKKQGKNEVLWKKNL